MDSIRSSRTSSIFNHNQPNQSVSDLSVATGSTMGAMMPSTSSIRPSDDSSTSPILVPVSVLKKPNRIKEQQSKQVVFFDGIRPGNDLTEAILTENQSPINNTSTKVNRNVPSFPSLSTFSTLLFPSSASTSLSPPSPQQTEQQQQSNSSSKKSSSSERRNSLLTTLICSDINGPLPSIINPTTLQPECTFADLVAYLDADESNYLRFQITKNLCINVNRVKLDSSSSDQMICWSFNSDGLSAFGQDEILILLESLDVEVYFPRDVLRLYLHVYDNAFKGKPIADLNLMLFEDGLFENKENCGFLFFSSSLFFRSNLKCLNKIPKPESPFLIGVLIQKWEVPWAKSLPHRLLLRLGSQATTYPCSIVSRWSRKATFQEIGHTIMNVLAVSLNYFFLFFLFYSFLILSNFILFLFILIQTISIVHLKFRISVTFSTLYLSYLVFMCNFTYYPTTNAK